MTFIKPMLARPGDFPEDESKWFLEPKHDGMRAIIVRTEDGVEIYSRTGKSQKGKCPHLEKELMYLPVGTVLDGELAILESFGPKIKGKYVPKSNFNKTMRVMGSNADKAVARQQEFGLIRFIIFDVLRVGDIDMSGSNQKNRSTTALSVNCTAHVEHNPTFDSNFREVYDELIAAGIEGAIIKSRAQKYEAGKRAKGWLKLKSEQTFDVVITGFTDGQGKYEGQVGAIEFSAYMPDGSLTYVGRCSGMTDEERREFSSMRKGTSWMTSPVVIEVKANDMVGSGEYRTPRHPQFVCIRVDKELKDCTMDQFKA